MEDGPETGPGDAASAAPDAPSPLIYETRAVISVALRSTDTMPPARIFAVGLFSRFARSLA
jgi:hypothetical protein